MALAVRALPVPMIQPPLRTLLVPAVGGTALQTACFRSASEAAIALPPIAVRTNPEHRLASLAATDPPPENHFSMSRHPPAEAGFDKGNDSCDGRVALMVAFAA
jgi:hypothetical protein